MRHNNIMDRVHPVLLFLYYLLVIVGTVLCFHPAYLLCSLAGAALFWVCLDGRHACSALFGIGLLILLLSVLNPLINTLGARVLFRIFGRPYTLEALVYGAVLALMVGAILLWFLSFNRLLTRDKLTAVFGNLFPAISFLFVLVLRFIPLYRRKASDISCARACIGKGAAGNAPRKIRLANAMEILSSLTSDALEGSVDTTQSMYSRGYGSARRTRFETYSRTRSDLLFLGFLLLYGISLILSAGFGWTGCTYTPELFIAPVSGLPLAGFLPFCVLCFLPTILTALEVFRWHFLISRI